MNALKRACARVVALCRRETLDREFDEEAQSHLDLAVDDLMARGTSEGEARRLARIRFGAIDASKEAHRDSRGLPGLEALMHDLRFAVRGLRRDRLFALAAVAMLAVAIGLNVTVFTVMDAMLFRGFPLVKSNGRLVYLQERHQSGACCISYADFEDWRAQVQAFEGMAFIANEPITVVAGGERPMDMLAFTISANTFGLLGVHPILGRDFAPADEVSGAAPVAIINHRFWESRFSRRADVVGLPVQINGTPATIIGVMPEGFDFPSLRDLWMPVTVTPELRRRGLTPGGVIVVGRLRKDASPQQARTELEGINRRLEAEYPATNRGVVPTLASHSQITSGVNAPIIWGSLWAAAWLVLLIACANLANLTLARSLGRWRDFATRLALGAGQRRLMRQILLESLMLAAIAGVFGGFFTVWGVGAWGKATASQYQLLNYTLDSSTLLYLAVIAGAAAMLCSLAPLAWIVRLGVSAAPAGGGRGVTQGLRGKHVAAGLVTGQMALAIVLLSGAGVLVRSVVMIVGAETGVIDPEHVLVGSVRLPSARYSSPTSRVEFFDRLEGTLRAIPGIEEGTVTSITPVNGGSWRPFEIEAAPGSLTNGLAVNFLTVGSSYFRVVGARLLSGRYFDDHDRLTTLPVAIVNQSFASTFWPGDQSVVGKRLRSVPRNQPDEWRVVVGVVPNIMQGDPLRQQFKPLVYLPFSQDPIASGWNGHGGAFRGTNVLLRTMVPPDQVARAVRSEVLKLDPDVSLEEFMTLKASFAFRRDRMDAEHSELGKHAAVAPVFAVIALLLAAIGLSAVIAHSVTQRTKEIGVRIAIGAAARDVRHMVLREGMAPVVIGLGCGLVASFGVNRILQSQLVGVSPHDPATMAGAPAVLIIVALLACQIPARRAMRVNPVVALRQD